MHFLNDLTVCGVEPFFMCLLVIGICPILVLWVRTWSRGNIQPHRRLADARQMAVRYRSILPHNITANLVAYNSTFLSCRSCGSGAWARLTWVPCKTAGKKLARAAASPGLNRGGSCFHTHSGRWQNSGLRRCRAEVFTFSFFLMYWF